MIKKELVDQVEEVTGKPCYISNCGGGRMDFTKAPKASKVIEALQKLIDMHGDLPLCADDPDTSWRMPVGIVHRPENAAEEWPERFEIKTDYHGDPKGLVEI